jgi:uncharacterized protein (DUF1800 family)
MYSHPRTATAVLACVLLAGGPALAQRDGAQDKADAAWRATSRLGYGPSPATAAAAQADAKAWALQQIAAAFAASQRAPAIPAELAAFNQPAGQLAAGYYAEQQARRMARADDMAPKPENFSREMQQNAAAWRLMACSDPALEPPLLARMTEFWFNHLNVFVGKGAVRPFVGHYAVNVIRANALGSFEDMLLASAQHPAMLLYLDQARSNARGINENYARELMELHTLGVNAGYTQNDVRELARILTGWTVGLQQGEAFRFAARLHDQGDKLLLGRSFTADGQREGEDAIRMLARHPATAQRIAQRLAETFVTDKPPRALVDSLAATFTRTRGDIRAVMRSLVDSPEFWREGNSLFKTPLNFACSALTAGGGVKDKRDIQLSLGFLAQAGQPLHGWQTPDGYKTDAATWLAPEALTRRADHAMALGGRMAEPLYLQPFLSHASRERIAREAPALRTGLTLASPDFMRK